MRHKSGSGPQPVCGHPSSQNIVEEIVEWSDEMTTIVAYLATLGAVVTMAALI
jgi:hypothetical protein